MWWLPLVALASSALQKHGAEKREREELLQEQLRSIDKAQAARWGADPMALASIDFPGQQAKLKHAQSERQNTLGSTLQAISALSDSGGSDLSDDGYQQKTAYAGADASDPIGIGNSDISGENDLLKRLDDYGIDYDQMSRERLWG